MICYELWTCVSLKWILSRLSLKWIIPRLTECERTSSTLLAERHGLISLVKRTCPLPPYWLRGMALVKRTCPLQLASHTTEIGSMCQRCKSKHLIKSLSSNFICRWYCWNNILGDIVSCIKLQTLSDLASCCKSSINTGWLCLHIHILIYSLSTLYYLNCQHDK